MITLPIAAALPASILGTSFLSGIFGMAGGMILMGILLVMMPLAAAAGGMSTDLAGALLGAGPFAKVLAGAPDAAIGFVEAHGLALIIGCLLWQAEPARKWHLTAAAVHALLGICNLVFWQLFIATDMLAMGYVTTSLHGLFFAL